MTTNPYEFEKELHQQVVTLADLQSYWTGYQALTNIPDGYAYKIEKEFAHKYELITGDTYISGAL